MAMNVGSSAGSGEPEVMIDINTTPLIDVMLVLLVMLIITIPIQLHAINLGLPVGKPPPQLVPPQVVKIDIDEHDKLYWSGEPVAGIADVDAKLHQIAKLPLAEQPELHLRPNKASHYKTVAAVMAAVKRLGLTKFGIVGSEQFIE